jgi:hypothetical protein
MDRTCKKCGRMFKLPCHLARHYTRKTPCDMVVSASAQATAKPVVQVAGTIINVSINPFGEETTDHIGHDTIKQVLDEALTRGEADEQAAYAAMLRAAELIYGDHQHPENITCYIPDEHNPQTALVHAPDNSGDLGWHLLPCSEVIPPMTKNATDLVFKKQPFADAVRYDSLMRALRNHEEKFKSRSGMSAMLGRNRRLLAGEAE